jgi:A/G-specific adenine glycosylase
MTRKESACALATRRVGREVEVLLEQRPASNSVMPGMWELPALQKIPSDPAFTVHHAIMQVNYSVSVQAYPHGRLPGRQPVRLAKTRDEAPRRLWIPADQAAGMALTGLARKILIRAGLIPAAVKGNRIAAAATREVV